MTLSSIHRGLVDHHTYRRIQRPAVVSHGCRQRHLRRWADAVLREQWRHSDRGANGANVEISNSTIEATGGGGGGNTGLSASGAGSTIAATDVKISLGEGGNDAGVGADSGGQVAMTGGSVTVPGAGGGETGLRASGSGSLITANGVDFSVTGGGGDAGAKATDGASIVTTNGSVSVVNGAGGLLQNGGMVTMTGTDVTASGNGAYGFLFNSGGDPNILNTATEQSRPKTPPSQ